MNSQKKGAGGADALGRGEIKGNGVAQIPGFPFPMDLPAAPPPWLPVSPLLALVQGLQDLGKGVAQVAGALGGGLTPANLAAAAQGLGSLGAAAKSIGASMQALGPAAQALGAAVQALGPVQLDGGLQNVVPALGGLAAGVQTMAAQAGKSFQADVQNLSQAVQQVENLVKTAQDVTNQAVAIAKPVVEAVQLGIQVAGEVKNIKNELDAVVRQAQNGGKEPEQLWKGLTWTKDQKYRVVQAQLKQRERAARPTSFQDVISKDKAGNDVKVEGKKNALATSGAATISQGSRGVCGPTAVMHVFCEWSYEGYKKYVEELLETGRCNGKMCSTRILDYRTKADRGARKRDKAGNETEWPLGTETSKPDEYHTPEIDWVTICSLLNTTKQILDYDGHDGMDLETLAIPEEIERWLKDLTGCVETRTIGVSASDWWTKANEAGGLLRGHSFSKLLGGRGSLQDVGGVLGLAERGPALQAAQQVSELIRQHGAEPDRGDVAVILLISAAGFLGKSGGEAEPFPNPNHYVRLLKPLTIQDGRVTHAVVYSYGAVYDLEFPDSPGLRFEDLTFAYILGSRTPGLLGGVAGVEAPKLGFML